jgi:hypothetical protein
MVKESQYKLLEALKAHISDLEAERDRAFEHDKAILDRRLEAATDGLDWLSTRLESVAPSNSIVAAFAGGG